MSIREEHPDSRPAPRIPPAAWWLGLLGMALGVGITLWWVDTRAPLPVLLADQESPKIEAPPDFRALPASNTPSAGNFPMEPETLSPAEASARQAVQFSGYESAFRQDRLDPSWAPGALKRP